MGATHPAKGVNGLELWDDRVERMSPHIKVPHHPPRRHLRRTDDKVESYCAGEDVGHGNLH